MLTTTTKISPGLYEAHTVTHKLWAVNLHITLFESPSGSCGRYCLSYEDALSALESILEPHEIWSVNIVTIKISYKSGAVSWYTNKCIIERLRLVWYQIVACEMLLLLEYCCMTFAHICFLIILTKPTFSFECFINFNNFHSSAFFIFVMLIHTLYSFAHNDKVLSFIWK